jgi:DNA transposition AAA+ family ATPase
MTNLQKEQTQAGIKKYLEDKDTSQNQLAYKLGISAATISHMLGGKWASIADEKWRKVWNYVNPEHLDGLFSTTDFNSVVTLCTNALKRKQMCGLSGDTGMGKTTALKAVAKGSNVHYYYVDGTVTPRVFLKDLLQEMGVPFAGGLNAMLSRIADELNTQADPLLIIDESAKLSDKMILIIHSLRDKTAGNCGIVLAGMPDFRNNLIKQVNRGTTGYAEFYRRINIWHEMNGLSGAEITAILDSYNITGKDAQREFKNLRKFGDLVNQITLHQSVNN